MAALEIEALNKSFGALSVISNVSLKLAAGERHAVIGPNGAGKTTLFNLITGWLPIDQGTIRVDGADIAGLPPQEVTRRGIARSFQRNTLMNGLTVGENLRLAAQAQDTSRFRLFASRYSFKGVLERARASADQMQLGDCFGRTVSELSYGQKRQLEVAMALCSEPSILLLDEPAAGTSPAERAQLVDLIQRLPPKVTLLLVEHDMDVVFDVCERITVLSYGRVLASGLPETVRNDPVVRDAYLGSPVLDVADIHTYYGDSHVLQGVSFSMQRGQCVALLGRNGVGKTTTLRSVLGYTPPRRGTIRYNGIDITREQTYRIVRRGIGYVPEDRGIFPSLTVMEHILAAYSQARHRPSRRKPEEIYHMFPALAERRQNYGNQLSGGEQQMLAIGRALVGDPDLLVMDEPSEGLAPVILEMLEDVFRRIKAERKTILLVEQNYHLATALANYVYVLSQGRVQFEGTPEALEANPYIKHTYLGV